MIDSIIFLLQIWSTLYCVLIILFCQCQILVSDVGENFEEKKKGIKTSNTLNVFLECNILGDS